MDGHPLELPPVYPCSQGAPIVFAVPLGFLRFNEKAHATVYCVRCPVHRLMIWTAPQKSGFFAIFTWFENSCGFLPLFPNSFLPGGSLPAFSSPLVRGCVTSPGDISHSDGHSIFKVQVLLQEQFSEKIRPFPYIQEVGKRAEKRRFPRLWIGIGRIGNERRIPCG